MKQEGIGEIVFVGTCDPFVAMTVQTVTGRCAMLLDYEDAIKLRAELEDAMRVFSDGKSRPREEDGE